MGFLRLSLVLLLFSSPALSQPGPYPQGKTYTVAGQVINQLTGAPIPRVLVQISGKAQLTGGEGEFSFPLIPEGRTQVSITKPGYFSPGARTRFSPVPITLSIGADSEKLLLKMVPEAVILGQVTGNDREPLEGVQLVLLQYATGIGPKRLVPVAMNSHSDEDGNFRLGGLPQGRYFLAVKAGNVMRSILGAQSPGKNETYPGIVYYPGTQDFAAAQPIDLTPGQKLDVQFELKTVPAYKISGTLIATAGLKQIYPPNVIDATGQPLFPPSSFDSESGRFEFKSLPAGNYRFSLRATSADDKPVISTRNVTIARAISDLKLPVRAGADIPVIIRTEFSKPQTPGSCTSHTASGIVQSDCSDFPRAHVELLSGDSVQSNYGTDFGPQKQSSALAVRNVPPGKYVVRARATFGGYIQSIRSGQLDLMRDELVVSEDGQVFPIELTVRDDMGELQLRLHTDSPNVSATIVVVPQFGLAPEPQVVGLTSYPGMTSYMTLAPGNYKVFAFDAVTGVGIGDSDGLEKFAAQGTSITVTANSKISAVVDLIKGDAQ